MRKFICIALLTCISFVAPGWGSTGHRVTGYIAEKHLSKKARAAMQRILGQQSLAMASNWMDEIRADSTYNYMTDWHWVTILDGETYDQSTKNPKGDVIQTIERIIAELKSKKLSAKDEAERLKMLIHLIGDIHQPLHVGGGNDRGGNNTKVTWFRTDSNLHRVWDSDMIDGTKLSYTELAESLQRPDGAQVKNWQHTSVREWATESMSYRKQVYDIGNSGLEYKYQYKYFNIVETRLVQAGVRLAGVLNEIYG